MSSIWITGANGFIGRHLARHLHSAGHRVHGIGHGQWPTLEATAWGIDHWMNSEIDASGLDALLRLGGLPDRIFHLAGGSSVGASLANPHEDFARTVSTSARLLEWVRHNARDARVVAASSAAVYGSSCEGQIGEDVPTRPYSPYGHHKLMMEQVCRSYSEAFGVHCTIVRLFSVYGPWLRKQLLWDMCSRVHAGADHLRLGGSGNELRDWVEITDVVRMLECASTQECDPMLLVNGGTGRGTPVSRIASLVVDAWARDIPVTFTGEARPGDPISLIARPSVLHSWGLASRVRVEDGIAGYVRWFQKAQA